MPEARIVAKGSGWRVYRAGRASLIEIDRAGMDPVELRLSRLPNDIVRQSLLTSLVGGAYGAVDRATAIEAMGADW